MNEQQDLAAQERAEIAARVANVKRSQSQYKKPGSDAPGFSITNTGDYQ
jgi:hypothetical protein